MAFVFDITSLITILYRNVKKRVFADFLNLFDFYEKKTPACGRRLFMLLLLLLEAVERVEECLVALSLVCYVCFVSYNRFYDQSSVRSLQLLGERPGVPEVYHVCFGCEREILRLSYDPGLFLLV